MKSLALSIILVIGLGFNVFAQTTNPSATPSTNSSKSSVKQAYRNEKQDWLDQYNKMKPKLDELKSKLTNQDKNGEFAHNVNKLDQMAADFRNKIDQWDAATQPDRDKLKADMSKEKTDLQELYNKTRAQWNDIKVKQGKSDQQPPK